MDASPPPEADGSSNGSRDSRLDDFLARLLTGGVRVKVDPASGRIVEVRDVPLDSPPEEAYDRPR